ncbi:MAG: aspartate/glutamate racemase family protein [Armatimonadota bacterium]|nr:aspartate/glutamate racemase family protein [Armatimonadota bacterium]MDR7426321.1 aspartate/glutamate racemase family protein [Armatimonadota bacterium]MDR7463252.1 aspartate/glutamate racemase family protein [Armatimonadota bacterium]MDR7469195.1 aspartate/glutamate racemase family protein [Armatimonadota bacterium]MDR7474740.1 aspartate/glutamate racemase family protein [Armatimonadota bacterium]
MAAVLHVIPVRARPGRVERERARLAAFVPGVAVHVIDLPRGPQDLEFFVDDHAAVGQMLEVLPGYVAAHRIGAVSIGCFYDPGLWELREALEVPVVGIGEAGLLLAGIVAWRLAVLVGDWKWVPKMQANAHALGLGHRICAWRSIDRSVQAMQDDPEETYRAVRRAASYARDQDHAEAVVLGCGALSGLAERLQEEVGMPVIDPVPAGVLLACALASLGLRTSKIGGYRPRG